MRLKPLFALCLTLLWAISGVWVWQTQLQLAQAGGPNVLFVAPAADCGGETPCFATIQEALEVANVSDQIKVAAGEYTDLHNMRPNISIPQYVTAVALITKTVEVMGGYTNTNWITPTPEINLTIIDANGQGSGIYAQLTAGQEITVQGFLIINAAPLQGPEGTPNQGSGIRLQGVSGGQATLQHNVLSGNQGIGGGGVHLQLVEQMTLTHNLFENNQAVGTPLPFPDEGEIIADGSGDGGGLYADGIPAAVLVVADNQFVNNSAAAGGGVALKFLGAYEIYDNYFYNNHAQQGGGLSLYNNPFTAALPQTVARNFFVNNHAELAEVPANSYLQGRGGGISVQDSTPLLTNNVFQENSASQGGDAVYIGSETTAILIHNSLVRNGYPAVFVGGEDVQVRLVNTLLFSHSVGISVTAGDAKSMVLIDGIIADQTPVLVEKVPTALVTISNLVTGTVLLAIDGFHLLTGSAGIDAGLMTALVVDDIDGQPRPGGSAPDLGADEWSFRQWLLLPLIYRP